MKSTLLVLVVLVALEFASSTVGGGADESWEGKGCPKGATGLYPYAFDCKRFFNCYKGRGSLTVCAPGTLFNPKTLQCDFPAKVDCFTAPENTVGRSARYEEWGGPPLHNHHHHPHHHHHHEPQGAYHVPHSPGNEGQSPYPEDGGQYGEGRDRSPYTPQYHYSPSRGSQSVDTPASQVKPPNSPVAHGGVQPPRRPTDYAQKGYSAYGSLEKNYERSSTRNLVKFPEPQPQSLASPNVNAERQSGDPPQPYNTNLPGRHETSELSSSQFGSTWNQQYTGRNVKFPQTLPHPPPPPPPPPPQGLSGGNKNGSSPVLFYPDPAQQVPSLYYSDSFHSSQSNSEQRFHSQSPYQGHLNHNFYEGSQNKYQGGSYQNPYQRNPNQIPNNENINQPPYQGSPNQHPYQSNTNVNQQHSNNRPSFDHPIQNPSYGPANPNPPYGPANPNLPYGPSPVHNFPPTSYSEAPKPLSSYPVGHPSQNLPYPSMFNTDFSSQSNSKTPVDPPSSFNSFTRPDSRGNYDPQRNPLHSKPAPNSYGTFESTNLYRPKEPSTAASTTNENQFDSNQQVKVVVYTECPSGYSGLLPHTSCSKFLSCAHGRTYVMDCGPGTRFHPEHLICAHPHQVKCTSVGDDSLLASESNNNGQVAVLSPVCSNNEFSCDDERCIPRSYVCNGFPNCLDGTDELNCASHTKGIQVTTTTARPTQPPPVESSVPIVVHQPPQPSCSPTQFSCDVFKCFHESRLCDGIFDCLDKTDEANCPSFGGNQATKTTARPTQTPPVESSIPIVVHQPPQPSCSPTQFSCDVFKCFHESRLCDGIFDCLDKTDEANCPSFGGSQATKTTARPTQPPPVESSVPIAYQPPQPSCSSIEFSCDAFKCFHQSRLCDGIFDCLDKTDEANCPSFDHPSPILDVDVRFGQTKDEDAEIMSTPTYKAHPANKTMRGFFIKPTERSVTKTVSSSVKTVTKNSTSPDPTLVFAETIKPIKSPILQNQHDRQVVRLRGGPTQMEGYVELRFTKGTWGAVCDQRGQWTLEEANLVCQNLGYTRGAEISWQGKPASANFSISKSDILIDTVRCSGSEDSIAECFLSKGTNCDVDQDVVWVRCFSNAKSLCHPGEISLNDKCYHLVVPTEEDTATDLAGFNQGEAMSHCQQLGGHLIGIQSQIENDYVSEWLLRFKEVDTVMTSGVGVSVMGMPIWIWEGSEEPFSYQNWWPGWRTVTAPPPKTTSGRASCIVLRRFFPCNDSDDNAEGRLCDSQYFFWDTEDCGTMSSKLPYVCKRPANKIGCIMGSGINYRGAANVTGQGHLCLPWNNPDVTSYLKYKISDDDRVLTLSGHNYCRNVGGSDTEPWCFTHSAQGLQKEYCDIPHCSKGVERSAKYMEYKCSAKMFSCDFEKECIPKGWVCDGKTDCTNGLDENNCKDDPLEKFNHFPQSKLLESDILMRSNVSLKTCAETCLEDENCRSFSYSHKSATCQLSESNVGLSGNLISGEPDWSYNERSSKSLKCNGLFVCDNGKCLSGSSLCNGRDECGDKSDEKNCSWLEQGIQLRLVGGKLKNEGTIEVKALGGWGLICDDQFDMNDANVVCRHLGYPLGAKEVRNSSTSAANTNGTSKFLIDDLHCTGTESTIADCDHNGWGVHDCNQEEAAGVLCKVMENECSNNYWQCRGVAECIPVGFLCDNVPDCHDKSDEDPANCNDTFSVRLVGTGGESRSNKVTEGRVEVKRFGVWGTVCDDDFGLKEAEVICNSLGFEGPAKAYKEAAFGAGTGIIWMDQVHCFGNETTVKDCMHNSWGQTNCKHDEDVAVACSPQKFNMDPSQHLDEDEPTPPILKSLEDILPQECGRVAKKSAVPHTPHPIVMQRVVSGFETTKGAYPWQASIRVRSISGKNSHWCGAIVITSQHVLTAGHCLRDYVKTAYSVRAGDFDSEVFEDSEQDHDVEQIWIHPDLDKKTKLNNDIGIVKVKGPGFVFNNWVKPACLPQESSRYTAGKNCTVSGWGSNSPGSGFVRTLHASWLPILPLKECKAKSVYGEDAITSGMFCAGSFQGGSDSCQGDSGGPFLCAEPGDVMTVYGITSWGLGCGRPNSPGVYTNVAHYLKWIHETITK